MKLDWRQAGKAFVARKPRERALILLTGLALLLAAGWLLWIEPAVVQRNRLQLQIRQHDADLLNLQPRLDALRTRRDDPNAGRRAQIELLNRQLARVDDEFKQFERSLVAPREMGRLVEALLKQHGGLQLLTWRSLPVASLDDLLAAQRAGVGTWQDAAGAVPGTATAPAARAGAVATAASAAAHAVDDSWLYVHGIEISVSGSYADMQAWLQQTEQLPRQFYWGTLTIDGKAWPASVMTVTLYTVSLERTWWAL